MSKVVYGFGKNYRYQVQVWSREKKAWKPYVGSNWYWRARIAAALCESDGDTVRIVDKVAS